MRRRATGKKRGSRWELERERFGLDGETAPAPDRAPQEMAGAVQALMKRLGLETEQWQADVAVEWPALVGSAVAAHARPGTFHERVLTIFVDHSTWLNELARYSKRTILNKLQQRFGVDRIRDLSFKLDPDGRGGTV